MKGSTNCVEEHVKNISQRTRCKAVAPRSDTYDHKLISVCIYIIVGFKGKRMQQIPPSFLGSSARYMEIQLKW
jgi:hypothetical protein